MSQPTKYKIKDVGDGSSSLPLKYPCNSWVNTIRAIPEILSFTAGLALLTGFLFFARFHDFYTPDSPGYIIPANNLVAGHGFSESTGYPETLRTPGYPLLLVPFLWAGSDLTYLIVFQHLLRICIALATTAFAFRLTGSRRQALAAGIVLCVDVPMLEAANTVMSEILFTAIQLIILWLLWTEAGQPEKRRTHAFFPGLLSGVSVLIRPVSLFFFLPAAAYLLLVRKEYKFRAVFSFVLAFAISPFIWAVRNFQETGYFTVTSISGLNMLSYRAAGVLAISDPGDFYKNLVKRQDQLQTEACEGLRRLYGTECAKLTTPQRAHYYSSLGSEILTQHPVDYARLAFRGATLMFLGGGADRFARVARIRPQVAERILLIYTLPTFCLLIVGSMVLWNENRPLFYLFFLVVIYFLVISAGAEAYSRFRVPILPIYAILVAVGWDFILRRSRYYHSS